MAAVAERDDRRLARAVGAGERRQRRGTEFGATSTGKRLAFGTVSLQSTVTSISGAAKVATESPEKASSAFSVFAPSGIAAETTMCVLPLFELPVPA